MYLLGFSAKAQDALWRLLETEAFKILALDASDAPRMRELMRKYSDLPMDLADAALVRVAGRGCRIRINSPWSFWRANRYSWLRNATGSPGLPRARQSTRPLGLPAAGSMPPGRGNNA